MRLLDNRAPKPKILLCSSKTCLAIKTSPLQLTFESFHTGRLIHYTYEIFLHARQKYGQVKSQPDVLRESRCFQKVEIGTFNGNLCLDRINTTDASHLGGGWGKRKAR